MKVLVFDIDGTLTQTTRVDGDCFRSAIQAVLPKVRLDSFDEFGEMTDTAILQEICSLQRESPYDSVEKQVLAHFMACLSTAKNAAPASFSAVPGARRILSAVRDAGWVPAIATGGWRPSAELKLDAARIPRPGVPLATSSEAVRRVDIIRTAVGKATSGTEPAELVYVGDGTWDIQACRELGIGFIGRAAGNTDEQLRRLGAQAVVTNFDEVEAFLDLLSKPRNLALSEGRP